jgi:hypothetical protein
MYSMALFLHFGSSFVGRMVRYVERNKGCSICKNNSPSFSLGKTKDSIQNNSKEVVFHFHNPYSHHDILRCGYKSVSPSAPCPGSSVAIRSLGMKCMTSLAQLFLMQDSGNLVLGGWNAAPSGHNYILCSFWMQLQHSCMITLLFFFGHS